MFPLVNYTYDFPIAGPAFFGAVRKHDIHTGIDLYAPHGAPVYSMAIGKVIAIENFTGESVNSPWWNETKAVVVSHDYSDIFVYGEVEPCVKVGQRVELGQRLGNVLTVLKEDKGKNPTSMLHFEHYSCTIKNWKETVIWDLGKSQPKGLKDPTQALSYAARKVISRKLYKKFKFTDQTIDNLFDIACINPYATSDLIFASDQNIKKTLSSFYKNLFLYDEKAKSEAAGNAILAIMINDNSMGVDLLPLAALINTKHMMNSISNTYPRLIREFGVLGNWQQFFMERSCL